MRPEALALMAGAKLAALVPLRGGSKGIPRKNIKPLAGQPLCAWVLAAARESGLFAALAVSTDDAEIAAVVRRLDPAVTVIDRPAELASDDATTESVMLHALPQLDCDVLCTLQATSPLLRARHLQAAWEQFRRDACDSMVSGTRFRHFVWHADGTPLNYDPQHRPLRQQFAGSVVENGAFYFTRRELLQRDRCRLGGKIGVFVMPDDCAVELDEPEDWTAVERLLLARAGARRGPQ